MRGKHWTRLAATALMSNSTTPLEKLHWLPWVPEEPYLRARLT